MMEHIVQFGITIDDDAIKRNLESIAAREITKELKEQIFNYNSWNDRTIGLSGYAEQLVRDFFIEYKDTIIEEAAKIVADSIKRSKKYKEALAKVTEEMLDE